MESSWYKTNGELYSISSQQLTDCSSDNPSMGAFQNDGCNGGFPQNAFYYGYTFGGMENWLAYPFADTEATCQYNDADVVSTFSSCIDVTVGDEATFTAGIAELGPISVAIDAGLSSFHNYVSGVYYAPYCSSTELDHAVTAVGFGTVPEINSAISATCTIEDFQCEIVRQGVKFTYPCMEAPAQENGQTIGKKITENIPGVDCNPAAGSAGMDFYMVKNSWGPLWGMNGYIMMARNMDNNCGIATAPTYIYANTK